MLASRSRASLHDGPAVAGLQILFLMQNRVWKLGRGDRGYQFPDFDQSSPKNGTSYG